MAHLQFGDPTPGVAYADRPAAYGLALRDGRIAAVQVTKPGHAPWLDLPGGGVDPGESEARALAREFGEETGLVVHAGALILRAGQFLINTEGEAHNIQAAVYETEITGEAPTLKVESDHQLVWLAPDEALASLRHEAHAWAVAVWIRSSARRPQRQPQRDAHG
jgi:8-oxo-dGTP diphosphatase